MTRSSVIRSAPCLAILHYRRQMQSGDFDLATVIEEYDHAWNCRMYGSVIGRGDDVFMSVTCSNRERLKGRSVQQLSNVRNHRESLAEALHPINSQRPESFSQSALPLNSETLPGSRRNASSISSSIWVRAGLGPSSRSRRGTRAIQRAMMIWIPHPCTVLWGRRDDWSCLRYWILRGWCCHSLV